VSERPDGADRREFLKRAGKVVWVVPAMQVVNMGAAAAGVEGSAVTTTARESTTSVPDE